MKKQLLLTAVILGLAHGSAQAGEAAGNYVTFFGGLNKLNDAKFSVEYPEYDEDYGSYDFKQGYLVGGAIGTHLAPNWRSELELSYRSNKVSSYYEGSDTSNLASDGDEMNAFAVMLNVWHDMGINDDLSFHLGGGVGGTMLQIDMNDIDDDGLTKLDDSKWVLAGQAGAGLSWNITDSVTTTLDYRFLATEKAQFSDEFNSNGGYTSHAVMVGIQIPLD